MFGEDGAGARLCRHHHRGSCHRHTLYCRKTLCLGNHHRAHARRRKSLRPRRLIRRCGGDGGAFRDRFRLVAKGIRAIEVRGEFTCVEAGEVCVGDGTVVGDAEDEDGS